MIIKAIKNVYTSGFKTGQEHIFKPTKPPQPTTYYFLPTTYYLLTTIFYFLPTTCQCLKYVDHFKVTKTTKKVKQHGTIRSIKNEYRRTLSTSVQ